jgi:carboxyl-terminal processing protease
MMNLKNSVSLSRGLAKDVRQSMEQRNLVRCLILSLLALLPCLANPVGLLAQRRPARLPASGHAAAAAAAIKRSQLWHETFDVVWRTVNEKHFDPTFGGVDWDKVRQKYEPRLNSIKTEEELYELLRQMIGELHESHFEIIPAEAMRSDPTKAAAAPGGIGVDLAIIDGAFVIVRVAPGSTGENAALRPGFIVRRVDDFPVDEALKTARLTAGRTLKSPGISNFYASRLVQSRMDGDPGTSVRILYLDENNQQREAIVQREKLKGEVSPPFANLPPLYIVLESKRLAGGIGYLRFNLFLIPLMGQLRTAIRSMTDAPGIIIDLRGNLGGLGQMSGGLAGMLEAEQVTLGTMKFRTGSQNMVAFPQKDAFLGPVAILIDQGSMSTSEIFAAGMQELHRAVIVGERSPGAALPSLIQKLPTGAYLQFAIADFRTPAGLLIEGRGITPDVEIKLSRAGLLSGHDAQIDAAIDQINLFNKEKKSAHLD